MMAHSTKLLFSLPLALLVGLAACKKEAPAATTGDAGASVACHIVDQDRCKELPSPSPEQRKMIEIECGSVSGGLTSPAKCGTAGFIGKCTIPANGADGPEVRRWYRAADAAYQQSFCVDTAKGVWSTTF